MHCAILWVMKTLFIHLKDNRSEIKVFPKNKMNIPVVYNEGVFV